jgi:hypothetical protein
MLYYDALQGPTAVALAALTGSNEQSTQTKKEGANFAPSS